MADAPNDRAKSGSPGEADPRIFVVVNGQRFPRPSLETFFAEVVPSEAPERQGGCTCYPVVGIVCTCKRICTCVGHCSCVGHSSCSCVGHSSGGGGGGGCRCAPVH
jgi:hypothetical protein